MYKERAVEPFGTLKLCMESLLLLEGPLCHT